MSLREVAGFSSAVRRSVPVRTFSDWNDPLPGFLEVDLVAHGGTSMAGAFLNTLVATDIATGWTECVPLVVRDAALVVQALATVRGHLPFALRGVDFDNDSVFMNDTVVNWCRDTGLEITRSRAYRKNDQAWVEQKNGAIVRRLVGYGRFDGIEAAAVLNRLYAAARLHGNVFLPSFKLKHKQRIGARVIKSYHPPQTPLERALAHPAIDNEARRCLQNNFASLDPVLLMAEIRAAQAVLGERVSQRGITPAVSIEKESMKLASDDLASSWKNGEQRATHRRRYIRRKPVPRRPCIFDGVFEEIDVFLSMNPGSNAVSVLAEMKKRYPERYDKVSVRTMQRVIKSWRERMARRLIGDEAVRTAEHWALNLQERFETIEQNRSRHMAAGNIPS